jgi:hypothetical protein
MEGDPLADVLTLASARCVRIGTLKAGGTWALEFPPPQKIKLTAVVKGTCWLAVDGERAPLRMETGDVFNREPALHCVSRRTLASPAPLPREPANAPCRAVASRGDDVGRRVGGVAWLRIRQRVQQRLQTANRDGAQAVSIRPGTDRPAHVSLTGYFCAVGRTTISFTSTSGGCSIANAIARAIASAGIAKVSRDCSSWALTV